MSDISREYSELMAENARLAKQVKTLTAKRDARIAGLEALARELWVHVPPRERVGEGFAERMRALGLGV